MYPIGSSEGLRDIAQGCRSGTDYALDKGKKLGELSPLQIVVNTGIGQLCLAAGIESENSFIALFFLLIFLHVGGVLLAVFVLFGMPAILAKTQPDPQGKLGFIVRFFADMTNVRWKLLSLTVTFFFWWWPALTMTALFQMSLTKDYAALQFLAYVCFFVISIPVPLYLHVRAVQVDTPQVIPEAAVKVIKPIGRYPYARSSRLVD